MGADMNAIECEECRDYLLDAEPAELRAVLAERASPASIGVPAVAGEARGEPASLAPATGMAQAVHAHLAACPECAAQARAILANNAALNAALTGLSGTAAATAIAGTGRSGRRWLRALLPLAAAAVLAVVLWQEAPRASRPLPPLVVPTVRVPASPEVNAGGASGVAIMRTNNPRITVVWTF